MVCHILVFISITRTPRCPSASAATVWVSPTASLGTLTFHLDVFPSLSPFLFDSEVILFCFQSGWILRLVLCMHFGISNRSHLTLYVWRVFAKQHKDNKYITQQHFDQVWMHSWERRKHESTTMHTYTPAFYLHAYIYAYMHPVFGDDFILSTFILVIFSFCLCWMFCCGSLLTVCQYATFHSMGVGSASKEVGRCVSLYPHTV